MIVKPPHDRKIGLCGVSLTKARLNRHNPSAMKSVQDEIESVIIDSGYLADAPFSWVTIAIRFGLKDESIPHYKKVDTKYGDLPLSIEVDTHRLLKASLEQLIYIYRLAVLEALIHAGKKFNLPTVQLEGLKQKVEQARISAP